MPTKYTIGASTRRTTDLKFPKKSVVLLVVTTTLFIASIGTLGYYANKFGKQMANNYADIQKYRFFTQNETSKKTDMRYC